jgi:hypothetical protein
VASLTFAILLQWLQGASLRNLTIFFAEFGRLFLSVGLAGFALAYAISSSWSLDDQGRLKPKNMVVSGLIAGVLVGGFTAFLALELQPDPMFPASFDLSYLIFILMVALSSAIGWWIGARTNNALVSRIISRR